MRLEQFLSMHVLFIKLFIAGGILFGFAFLMISRGINYLQLKNSIIITGVGLIVLAGVNSTLTLIMTSFPHGVSYQFLFQ
jgi:hypothetical protein